jgi:hypothetical protein
MRDDEPSLSQSEIRELGRWYEDEGDRRRVGGNLDQDALNAALCQRLAERGVSTEFIPVEFERVMQTVFAVKAPAGNAAAHAASRQE